MKTTRFNINKSYIVYLIVFILIILQITASNRLTGFSKRITTLDKQISVLNMENERVKKNIASASALTSITVKAQELGFTSKAEIVYLDELYSVAQNSL